MCVICRTTYRMNTPLVLRCFVGKQRTKALELGRRAKDRQGVVPFGTKLAAEPYRRTGGGKVSVTANRLNERAEACCPSRVSKMVK